jgi:3'-5' exoribonuclease
MTIAKDYILSEELKTSVGHCILAHHGRQEWGSPIEPQTVEAMIIHYADMLSAQHAKDYYERN